MAAGVLLLTCTVQCVWPMPSTPSAVLTDTAVVSCTVSCRVCGVRVMSVSLCCSCSGVSSVCYPLVVVVGGAIAEGRGGVADGGWHDGGRAAVLLTPRLTLVFPPV